MHLKDLIISFADSLVFNEQRKQLQDLQSVLLECVAEINRMSHDDKKAKQQSATSDFGLKLFVWTGFSPDYKAGLAIAVASSEERARQLIVLGLGYSPTDWGALKVLSLDTECAFSVTGGQ